MSNIKLFESVKIRSHWNEEEQKWYFSVTDVIEALTDTVNPKDYIKKMRKRDSELNFNWGTICTPLEMLANKNLRGFQNLGGLGFGEGLDMRFEWQFN